MIPAPAKSDPASESAAESGAEGAAAAASEPAADILHQAMHAHRDGDQGIARRLYQQLLADDPQHPDALHLLGVLEAQAGHTERAAQLIQRALLVRPDEPMFLNNMGNVLVDLNRADTAEMAYARAAELDPRRVDARGNLAVLLGRRGEVAQAEQMLRDVIRDVPGFSLARSNLAALLINAGRMSDAVLQCEDALAADPGQNGLRPLLGRAYAALGKRDEVIAVYRDWLAVEPGNPVAEHHLRAYTGDAPERAPDAYVVTLFDEFSSSFDASLSRLDYRAPQQVADALARTLGAPAQQCETIVDAGCGTGLVGPLVKPWTRRLVGLDLSAGMLRRAAARRVYDDLAHGELVDWLRAHPACCDTLVAADTLIYFGVLDGFAAAAQRALRPGGRLIFTLEAEPQEQPEGRPDGAPAAAAEGAVAGYRLHGHGRYSHRRAYVQTVLQDAGFVQLDIQSAVPRKEAGVPVAGWVVCACAAPAPA